MIIFNDAVICITTQGDPTEISGTWIVEAPLQMELNEDILQTLGSSLDISLHHLVVYGVSHNKCYSSVHAI